ncbi:MAG: DUF2085 domain-containing protein [Candidatus Aminicenantes bacterium]|nr:DUF2085 domain-containing protein [Candidatus Aminicenantes bacterium]
MKIFKLAKTSFLLWLTFLFINIFFIILIILAPIFQKRWPSLSSAIYLIFTPFCHQIEDRCFSFKNLPLAVCSRCFGIIVGFLLGITTYPIFKRQKPIKTPNIGWFVGASMPMAIDLLGNICHLWSSSNWLRFIIGSIWGILLPFYFLPAVFAFGNKNTNQINSF